MPIKKVASIVECSRWALALWWFTLHSTTTILRTAVHCSIPTNFIATHIKKITIYSNHDRRHYGIMLQQQYLKQCSHCLCRTAYIHCSIRVKINTEIYYNHKNKPSIGRPFLLYSCHPELLRWHTSSESFKIFIRVVIAAARWMQFTTFYFVREQSNV